MKSFEDEKMARSLNINELEAFRIERKAEEKKKTTIILIAGLSTVAFVIIIAIVTGSFFIAFGGIVGPLIGYGIWWSSVRSVYIKHFKTNVVQKILKDIDESYNYEPDRQIDSGTFSKANFIKSYSSMDGEDYISGKIDDTPFEFSEITVSQKSGKNTRVVFSGMFFAFNPQQKVDIKMELVPDHMEKAFGEFGRIFQKMNLVRDTLVKIDNAAFEKEFAVYSKDPGGAQYILNYDLQEFLLSTKNQSKANIYLSFNQGIIYFGIDDGRDIFKVNINESLMENNRLQEYYDDIKYYINLAKQLFEKLPKTMPPRETPLF